LRHLRRCAVRQREHIALNLPHSIARRSETRQDADPKI
jgi:hypothetical protein